MKYVSDHTGSTYGAKSGRKYRYEADEPFDAPADEFPHVEGITSAGGGSKAAEPAGATPESEATSAEYPTKGGGGWWTLSNGEKVQGEDNAFAAQAALDEEE